MKRIVSVVLSLFSLSLSIFPANAQDGTAEPVSWEWQSRKWEGVMEANLNGNFSTSSRYYVAEYTIGMKYCLAERWSLGFECVGVAPFAFQDRQQTFSSVIDLGLSGAFRIISEDRDRMDLNIGIGSSVLAYSKQGVQSVLRPCPALWLSVRQDCPRESLFRLGHFIQASLSYGPLQ